MSDKKRLRRYYENQLHQFSRQRTRKGRSATQRGQETRAMLALMTRNRHSTGRVA